MKKIKNKKSIFIIIFLLVISSTVAYLYSTDTFQNIFVAASYKVTLTETFESPNNWKPGDTTPKTATIKNEGTVPIKVRVKLEEEWKDSNNQDLPLQHNDEIVAIINFSNQDDYIYKDGYYYYDLALNPGETTSSIIESVTFNPNYSGTVTCVENDDSTHTCSSSESGYEGGTYKLTLTIEGVQEDYYVQAWGLSGEIYKPTLYNALKRESESNGLAREYTGEHHDSFTEEPSQKIYHWYASNNTQGTEVQNKNNVIFAKHCWQMLRTTDTGGVKMIYNGEAVDNQCLSTRGTHVGYAARTSQNLASNYWYGTDYTYDSTAKTFKVSGITEQTTWNATTGPELIGKYTCRLTSEDGSCSTLYLVESYYNTSSAYVMPLNSNSNYSQFGTLQFNASENSPSYVGYMYGDVYENSTIYGTANQSFIALNYILYAFSISLNTNYWYADSILYDSTNHKYLLVNPYKVSSTSDYPSLVGKYTFGNTTETYKSSSVYYIAGVNGSNAYYKELQSGNLLSAYEPIVFGDSITDNGNGTYTVNNPTSVTLSNWYINYANYKNKYTCNDISTTCAEPRYTTDTSSTVYDYIKANEKIMIGKSKSGVTLIDTILVRKDELIKNSSNYGDYKYTCNIGSEACTESNLRIIKGYRTQGYDYFLNYYFGSSVTWDGINYTLVDIIENSNNLNNLSTHHYICPNPGEKVCSEVAYVYYYTGSGTMYYITLKDGVTTVDKALEDMLTKNTTNSTMKSGVDAWYKHYLLEDYDDFLEDTVFCNDRSIIALNGWNPDGGMTNEYLQFKKFNAPRDLSCTNTTDQFSISNNNAKLTYKVGLMTLPEMSILNNTNNILKTGKDYWLASPYLFNNKEASGCIIFSGGVMASSRLGYVNGVRPAISLIPGIMYTEGDGSKEHPYIVKMD